MRVRSQLFVVIVAVLAVLGSTGTLQAATITQADLLEQGAPTGAAGDIGSVSVGELIVTAGAPVVVRAVGFWDEDGDGLATSHDIGIWDTPDALTGTLLASATVPSGTAAPLYEGYRWVDLATPLTLDASHNYYELAAFTTEGGDAWHTAGGGLTLNPSIASDGASRWESSGSLIMPTANPWSGGIYGIVNFSTASSIPEPGTLVMLATGIIGLLAYAWRKRK